MDGSRFVLFVGSDDNRWRTGSEDFTEVAFALNDGVGIGAIDNEDDAVGS